MGVYLCVGALLMVICFSVVLANTYHERALLLHAGASVLGVLAIGALIGGQPRVAEASMLLLLAVAALQLRDLVSNAGVMRNPQLWLLGVGGGLLPLLAVVSIAGFHTLPVGVAAWAAVTSLLMLRAWPQSQPWILWLATAYLPLLAASAWLGWRSLDAEPAPALPLAALVTAWAAMNHLATTWRSRMFSETRARVFARNRVDPLTGLATPLVLHERVHAVRSLIRRYGHPSVLMLVCAENLPALSAEFGPEVAESAVLTAANRIREMLGEGDIAARVSHSRVALLCEGVGLAEGASNVASRILVAGLKQPLSLAPSEFLHFRIVIALVPASDLPAQEMLQRMSHRMDTELQLAGERRIVTLAADELA
ncbi:MAG: diguanylate cyclase [Ramlibacter sp.]|nr:diguanylate cyclase [Ramlibacter sp.]